ncbi:hypothetical protein LSAT2_009817 [Lamellibrachia satsuma]|nr:hypothetical protein LSAT2_009817 [Lamellibrachia satsuma]
MFNLLRSLVYPTLARLREFIEKRVWPQRLGPNQWPKCVRQTVAPQHGAYIIEANSREQNLRGILTRPLVYFRFNLRWENLKYVSEKRERRH